MCAWGGRGGGGHSEWTVGGELGGVAGYVLKIGRRRQPRRQGKGGRGGGRRGVPNGGGGTQLAVLYREVSLIQR